MPRPETVDDFDLDNIQIATFQVDAMGTVPDLLLAYAAFLKGMEKAKAIVTSNYNGVIVEREPNAKEQAQQLESRKNAWDERQKQYEIYAAVGNCEYDYQNTQAKRHAEEEGLPWPPDVEPIALSDTLDRIDAVVSE